jgi:hypothetical protein
VKLEHLNDDIRGSVFFNTPVVAIAVGISIGIEHHDVLWYQAAGARAAERNIGNNVIRSRDAHSVSEGDSKRTNP